MSPVDNVGFSLEFLLHALQAQTCLRTYECHCPQSSELQPLKLKSSSPRPDTLNTKAQTR